MDDPPTKGRPFEEAQYRRAHAFSSAQGNLMAQLMWLTMFLGAARTREQYEALLADLGDVERAAGEFLGVVRALIAERLELLAHGNGD